MTGFTSAEMTEEEITLAGKGGNKDCLGKAFLTHSTP